MGYYINQNSKGEQLMPQNKAHQLIQDGAKKIPEPTTWEEGIVCVMENPMFDAAGYCYNQNELKEFKHPDGRRKTWLLYLPAKNLSGYEKAKSY